MFDVPSNIRILTDSQLLAEFQRVQSEISDIRRNPERYKADNPENPICNAICSLRHRQAILEMEITNRRRNRNEYHVIQGK